MLEEKKVAIEICATNQSLTYCDVKQIVDYSIQNKVRALCIPQSYVKWAKNYSVKNLKISTLVDVPSGYSVTLNKINAIKLALKNGADEVEVAINHCELKSGKVNYINQELKQIRRALRGRLFKLYFNYNLLNESEIIILTRSALASSVDYLCVDFNYDEQDFEEKLNLLTERLGKKIKLKLNTKYSYDTAISLHALQFEGRISVSAKNCNKL